MAHVDPKTPARTLTGIRILAATDIAPMPAFVTGATTPPEAVAELRHAFATASEQPWFPPLAEALCLAGFAPVDQDSFGPTLRWAREAEAAGYAGPA